MTPLVTPSPGRDLPRAVHYVEQAIVAAAVRMWETKDDPVEFVPAHEELLEQVTVWKRLTAAASTSRSPACGGPRGADGTAGQLCGTQPAMPPGRPTPAPG